MARRARSRRLSRTLELCNQQINEIYGTEGAITKALQNFRTISMMRSLMRVSTKVKFGKVNSVDRAGWIEGGDLGEEEIRITLREHRTHDYTRRTCPFLVSVATCHYRMSVTTPCLLLPHYISNAYLPLTPTIPRAHLA